MSTQSQLAFKILLIGSSGVGKTSIIQQYIASKIQIPVATIGVEQSKKVVKINNQIVSLQIWDTSGMEKFQPYLYPFYRFIDCLIIVIKSSESEPIKTLDYWNQQSHKEDPENFPIFVIQMTLKKMQWCLQNEIKEFFKVSAKDNQIINEIFLEITKILLEQKENMMNKDKQVIDRSFSFSKIISSKNTIMKQQLKCNMQEKIDQIQCYNQHDSPPSIVLLDNNLKRAQRLICSQCINDIKGRFNGINIDEAIQTIQERKNILDIISDSSQRILSILNNYLGKQEINKLMNLKELFKLLTTHMKKKSNLQQIYCLKCFNVGFIFSHGFFKQLNLQLKSDYAEKKQSNQIQYKLVQGGFLQQNERVGKLTKDFKLENELISCSIDKTIKIWRISYDQNYIKLFDSPEKHQYQVLSINQQVILWEKNQNLKWQFKNIILLSIQEINRGVRFLMDNQIICKTSQGQIEGYKLVKDQYQRQQVFDFEAQNLDEKPQEFQIFLIFQLNQQQQSIINIFIFSEITWRMVNFNRFFNLQNAIKKFVVLILQMMENTLLFGCVNLYQDLEFLN
ncbi:unnamed protein product [Paramecium sonneborni]|uniref:Uncharacterized protein n=1 Tax=Paramecium sonneborni TaxID=65129 RepID=A0A8S1RSY9_9CILI|nr:unnamed protein product [Paramecium sonneborni]